MLSSTRPSSQSYQVAAVWGEPSGRSVATTAAFGRERNSDTSSGTGTRGIAGPNLKRALTLSLTRSVP